MLSHEFSQGTLSGDKTNLRFGDSHSYGATMASFAFDFFPIGKDKAWLTSFVSPAKSREGQ